MPSFLRAIVSTVVEDYDELANSLLNRLPLYLTGRVESVLIPETSFRKEISESVVLRKDHLLLYDANTMDTNESGTTIALQNPVFLQDVYKRLRDYFQNATALFSLFHRNDGEAYAKFLSGMSNLNDNQYVFMRFPFVNVIPTNMIRRILEANQKSE